MADAAGLDDFTFDDAGLDFEAGGAFDDALMDAEPFAPAALSLDDGGTASAPPRRAISAVSEKSGPSLSADTGAPDSLDDDGGTASAPPRRAISAVSEKSGLSADTKDTGAPSAKGSDTGALGELPAALATAVMAIRDFDGGREPSLANACAVLQSVHGDKRALKVLKSKPSASPVYDEGFQVYVIDRRLKRDRGAAPANSFAVTFQSAHNSETWFAGDDAQVGVSARPMGRTTKRAGSSVPHGYRGKLYTLVERAAPGEARSVKVVDDNIGLVRVWRVGDESRGNSVSSREREPSPPPRKKRSRAAPRKKEERVRGDLRVEGDLVVDGHISGRVITPEGAADYAEWFPWAEGEGPAPPGTVARLESGSRLSLDTRGPGPCMVTSTSPSIAAGVPAEGVDGGALLAFMGQVPIRCVGPVAAGDRLVPSGRGDGLAVAEKYAPCGAQRCEALGTAMAASDPKADEEHTVLAFVRWQAAIRRELEADSVARQKLGFRWAMVALAMAVTTVGLAAVGLHFELLVFHNCSSVHAALFAALWYLTILQAFIVLALAAPFRENAPCKVGLGVVAVFGLVVAAIDIAHGTPNLNQAPGWLVLLWCTVSMVFHLVALRCAALVLMARVEPPSEEPTLDYAVFDVEKGLAPAPAPRRNYSNIVAVVATVCAVLWMVLAPSIIAVIVVNRDLNRRINQLEDDGDDNWEMPKPNWGFN